MSDTTSMSSFAFKAAALALLLLCGACSSAPLPVAELTDPAPDHLLPPDEMMSCAATAISFRYAAARVARLQLGLDTATLGTFETGHFLRDAPAQITQEEQRLDALADLQRDHGCLIIAPRTAVAAERARLLSPGSAFCSSAHVRCMTPASDWPNSRANVTR